MKFGTLLLILLYISVTQSYIVKETNSYVENINKNAIFLAEFQNSVESNSDEKALSFTWSDIVADVLVKGMKKSFMKNRSEVNDTLEKIPYLAKTGSTVTNILSRFLKVYKVFIYDKLFSRTKLKNNFITPTTKPVTYEIQIDLSDIKFQSVEDNKADGVKANSDLDFIGPKYNGKLCVSCDNFNIDMRKEIQYQVCPEGLKKDTTGKCREAKSSNFIISVPDQCPLGYKADWFGICRIIF